jgi:signal transduction histidine kinase
MVEEERINESPKLLDSPKVKTDIELGRTVRESGVSKNGDSADEKSMRSSGSLKKNFFAHSTVVITILILFLGVATSAAFLRIGIAGGRKQQEDDFEGSATDRVDKIRSSFEDYENSASLVHNRCRHRDFTRQDFRELYEYLIASGLEFKSVQFAPNVTRDERPAMEAKARDFYANNYPHVNYRGFVGFNTLNSSTSEPRTNQSFYFPIHYNEPIVGNEAAIDLDYYSSESRIRAVTAVFENQQPSLTDRLSLVKTAGQVSRCGDHNGTSFGVVLMHPGVNLTTPSDVWPRDFSTIVLCIPDLLRRATNDQGQSSLVYVHDMSHPTGDPVFMGGARVVRREGSNHEITFLDEIELDQLNLIRLSIQREVHVANRIWTVTVISLEGTYEQSSIFVIVGGMIIFAASVCLALWVFTNSRRMAKFNTLKTDSDTEKASLILDHAQKATKAERELNDFIAHEVRNPVAAAMAACSFVKTAVNKENPLVDDESRELARDDVNIIDNALHFVNDLLRNMLDMHRASNNQLQVTMTPTDLLHDVMEPVAGLLYQRGNSKVKLIVECPENLFVMTDNLRLKQIILNLGRNSSKFIDEGFIRLKAEVVNGHVQVYVDDSGSGIPAEKRQQLFAKYQESLDMLNQGTVRILVSMMDIYPSYSRQYLICIFLRVFAGDWIVSMQVFNWTYGWGDSSR